MQMLKIGDVLTKKKVLIHKRCSNAKKVLLQKKVLMQKKSSNAKNILMQKMF